MDKKTIRKFRKILRRFEWELDTQTNSCGCCGVTLPQCHALMALDEGEGINLNELAARMRIDTSTASRIVDGLVKRNLIERIIPPENRRSVNLYFTESGRKVCNNIHQTNDTYFTEVLDKLNQRELQDFLLTFEKVSDTMEILNKLEQNQLQTS
jgi:DNA-binding MarR family transcriptional regulator